MVNILPSVNKSQNGQAVLIVLLTMAVLFTLGLSVVSRSITDVRISEQSQESARAFWTAQAGLEKALLGQAGTQGIDNDVSYTVTKTSLGGEDFVLEDKLSADENFTFWLVEHDASGEIIPNDDYKGDITIFWGNTGESASSGTPALVASLVYQESGRYRSKNYAFDPYSNRNPKTFFSAPETGNFTLAGSNFAFKAVIPSLPANCKPYYLNLRLLFNTSPQIIGVQTGDGGISQGTCFDSEATVLSSNIVRKLRECRTWSKVPDLFNYLLFSGGNFGQ